MSRIPQVISIIGRIALGALFLYAGIVKLREPEALAASIASYRLLPPVGIDTLAAGLPPFEILLGALLLSGWQLRGSAFAAMVLTGIFALALASALARGLVIDCGCLGEEEPTRGGMWFSLGRDLVCFAVATTLYVHARRRSAQPPQDPTRRAVDDRPSVTS